MAQSCGSFSCASLCRMASHQPTRQRGGGRGWRELMLFGACRGSSGIAMPHSSLCILVKCQIGSQRGILPRGGGGNAWQPPAWNALAVYSERLINNPANPEDRIRHALQNKPLRRFSPSERLANSSSGLCHTLSCAQGFGEQGESPEKLLHEKRSFTPPSLFALYQERG